MRKELWAFIDNRTNDILGMVMTITHRAEIERIATDALSNPSSVLRRYPQDFTLRKIGVLTSEEGVLALTSTIGDDDTNVQELADKVEVNYQRAREEEEAEKRAQRAYEEWARDQQQHGGSTNTKEISILQKLFGGKDK